MAAPTRAALACLALLLMVAVARADKGDGDDSEGSGDKGPKAWGYGSQQDARDAAPGLKAPVRRGAGGRGASCRAWGCGGALA